MKKIDGWKGIPIVECHESLVSLSEIYKARIAVISAYHASGIQGAVPDAYLREGVSERLIKATELLPLNYRFAVLDAWRPLEVQASLFKRMLGKNRDLHPQWSEADLVKLAEQYAAYPSEDEEAPYPHSTGGALDITIMDNAGNLLEMGAGFDELSPQTATRFYEERLEQGYPLSRSEQQALSNRRMLFHALHAVGFTNYHGEWWHFDFGNQLWAVQKGTTARYGRISLQQGVMQYQSIPATEG